MIERVALCALTILCLAGCRQMQVVANNGGTPNPALSPPPAGVRTVAITPQAATFDFESDALGTVPAGFRIGSTSANDARGTWEILQGPDVPSRTHVVGLTNPGHEIEGGYNLLWTENAGFRDGEVQVDVRPRGGRIDQGGGVMWRVQDANNYYVCRWNPLEHNLRLYVVARGERHMLATAETNLSSTAWRQIHVTHIGSQITCTLSDQVTLTATDDTIDAAGGVGLWTKADAMSAFDALIVTPR